MIGVKRIFLKLLTGMICLNFLEAPLVAESIDSWTLVNEGFNDPEKVDEIQWKRIGQKTLQKQNDQIIYSERDELSKNYYLLGPGDYLNIIFEDETLPNNEIKILNDGSISIPYAGSIYIEDLTIEQAKNKIIKKLSKELISPQIQVSISKPRSIKVSLVGEVRNKGIYTFQLEDKVNSNLPTVVTAIQKAGGIKKDADLTEVDLIRKFPTFDGKIKKKIISLNLKDLILQGDQSQNPFLFDGDIIRLKEADDLLKNRNNEVLRSFASKTIRVTVIGEVEDPGNLVLPNDITLNQAIFAAGGPINSRANTAKVNLFSFRNNGTLSKETFGIDLSKAKPSKFNPNLNDGDVIKVNKNSLSRVIDPLNTATNALDPFIKTFTLIDLINGD